MDFEYQTFFYEYKILHNSVQNPVTLWILLGFLIVFIIIGLVTYFSNDKDQSEKNKEDEESELSDDWYVNIF